MRDNIFEDNMFEIIASDRNIPENEVKKELVRTLNLLRAYIEYNGEIIGGYIVITGNRIQVIDDFLGVRRILSLETIGNDKLIFIIRIIENNRIKRSTKSVIKVNQNIEEIQRIFNGISDINMVLLEN